MTGAAGLMGFDYNSVLMAAGAAGVALGFTLFSSWLRQRPSHFLFTWAISISIVLLAIVMFLLFQATRNGLVAMCAGVLLTTAYAVEYGGLTQFRGGRFDTRTVVWLGLLGATPIIVTGLMGFDGLSFLFINLMSAILLGFSGYHFWQLRSETPVPITAIVVLHAMLSVSYVLCVAVLAVESPLYLHGEPPNNWAEVLNLVLSVIAITGIGGLFVTIHQERISRQHQVASLTDALTGLNNRRALFDRFPTGTVPAGTGLAVFDLDDFKGLNDRYGHAVGDGVLQAFAALLVESSRREDAAIRLGGEEFLLIMSESSSTHALALAERIRHAMGSRPLRIGEDTIACTVSAGVAVADKPAVGLDTLLRKADNALYLSKRAGRNRVSQFTSSAA